MVRSHDEIMQAVNTLLGDRTDDDALGFIEDVQDTINNYETITSDATDWKTKYETNDAEWRKRYKDRFMGHDDTEIPDPEPETPVKRKFEDLFDFS